MKIPDLPCHFLKCKIVDGLQVLVDSDGLPEKIAKGTVKIARYVRAGRLCSIPAAFCPKCPKVVDHEEDNLGNAIDSGIGLSITIDKLRVFINKTLSILNADQ